MTLDDLNKRFVWTQDHWVDSWHIMQGDGPLRGDCDDYACTALYVVCGENIFKFWFMLLTFQAVIWFVYSPDGGRHVALWVRGKGWIDNWYTSFGPLKHTKRFPAIMPIPVIKLFLGLFF